MTGCAAPRHDGHDEPTPAEPSAYLCGPCHYGLAKDLRRLPHHHAELDVLPSRVAGAGNGDGLPFNDTASECRSQIRRDLTFWCREVTETRGLDPAPPWADDGWAANPVPAMAGWLAGQVKWIIFRDWAPLMAGAIHDDATRARTLLDPYVTARIVPQGQDGLCLACESKDPCTCDDCGEVFSGIPAFTAHFARDNRDRLWCELPSVMGLARSPSGRWSNRVVVTVYKSDGDRRRSFIWCRGCDGRWEPEQWLSYGQRVVKRREAIIA